MAKDISFHSFRPFEGLSVTTAVCMLTELRRYRDVLSVCLSTV